MADPRNVQSASRLSEDIGDVLNAIRRMIAEDDALSTARERLIAERDALDSLVQEDAGEFLARRYGGNAALARRLAGITETQTAEQSDPAEPAPAEELWPFGDRANAADAAQPVVPEQARPYDRQDQPRNDLARILSAGMAPQDVSVDQQDAVDAALPGPAANVPEAPRGWRAWVAPEPRPSRWAAPDQPDEAPETAAETFEALVAGNDFDEAFDWKSRMRPDLDDAVPVATAETAQEVVASEPEEATPVCEYAEDLPEAPVQVPSAAVAQVFSSPFAGYQAVFSMSGLPVAALEPSGLAGAGNWSLAHAGAVMAPDAGTSEPTMAQDDGDTSNLTSAPVADDGDRAAMDAPEVEALLLPDTAIVSEPTPEPQAVAADLAPTVTGLPPEDEEASIRDLLREMIQEELHGELGERFSRNIRAVIRREVAAAIDAHLERF